MGRHKLLLPWPESATRESPRPARQVPAASGTPGRVIEHVLSAWTNSRVHHTLIVIRRSDTELLAACQGWPVAILQPEFDPPDMKSSLQAGIAHLRECYAPRPDDGLCVAPADLPTLSAALIDQVIAACELPSVTIPYFGGKAGHPVILPWKLTSEVFLLAENQGLDALLARQPQFELHLPPQLAVDDIDTPAEYQAGLRAYRG